MEKRLVLTVSQTRLSICLTIYEIFVNISQLSYAWASGYAHGLTWITKGLCPEIDVFCRQLSPEPFAYSPYP